MGEVVVAYLSATVRHGLLDICVNHLSSLQRQACSEASFGSQAHTQYGRHMYNFLRLAAAARQISMAFNPQIRWSFQKLDQMSPASDILEVQAILNGVALESAMPPAHLEFSTPDLKSVRSMRKISAEKPANFMFVESQGKVLLLLGVSCQLPRLQVEFDSAFVRLKSARRVGPSDYEGQIQIGAGETFPCADSLCRSA